MTVMSSADCRFIKLYKGENAINWNNFLFAADVDYVSFFMQYHIGLLTVGTVTWTIQQTLEKYCKAILSKYDSVRYSEDVLSKRPFSHNLLNLWSEIKNITIQFSYEQAYDDLINEINTVTTDTRYTNYSMFTNLGLIEAFTVFGCEFRYELLGRDEFHNRFFGLSTDLLSPRAFLNNYSFNDMFRKLMHMSIEHGISFSGMGIPDTYKWTGVDLSRATGKFCQCGKHADVEKNCPLCCKKIWKNGMRQADEFILLREYFSGW